MSESVKSDILHLLTTISSGEASVQEMTDEASRPVMLYLTGLSYLASVAPFRHKVTAELHVTMLSSSVLNSSMKPLPPSFAWKYAVFLHPE